MVLIALFLDMAMGYPACTKMFHILLYINMLQAWENVVAAATLSFGFLTQASTSVDDVF